MKRNIFKSIVSTITCLLLFTGCINQIVEEAENIPQGEPTTLTITTRSGEAEPLTYPVLIYAFDANGKCAASKKLLTAEDTNTEMTLPGGTYTLVALSDTEGYTIPASPTVTDVITLTEGVPADGALKMSSTPLPVNAQTKNVTLVLTAPVSRIKLALKDIPEEITDVSVQFNKLYSGIDFSNTYSGDAIGIVSLTKNVTTPTTWETTRFHLFPSQQDSRISLSITFTEGEQSTTYVYTSTEALTANTPYEMTGTYTGTYGISSTITSGKWNETKYITFEFGDGNQSEGSGNGGSGNENTKPSDNTATDNPTYEVSTFPSPCSIWNGHFVALVNGDGNSATLTLLSLRNWEGITPNVTDSPNPTAAADIAKGYSESTTATDSSSGTSTTIGTISRWSIPTQAEAYAIRSTIGEGKLTETNNVLKTKGEELYGDNEHPYLCADAAKRIVWSQSGSTSSCNANQTYFLRLIATVTVTKKQP